MDATVLTRFVLISLVVFHCFEQSQLIIVQPVLASCVRLAAAHNGLFLPIRSCSPGCWPGPAADHPLVGPHLVVVHLAAGRHFQIGHHLAADHLLAVGHPLTLLLILALVLIFLILLTFATFRLLLILLFVVPVLAAVVIAAAKPIPGCISHPGHQG